MEGKYSDSRRLNRKCSIFQLDSFIDESNVIRVGGRLQSSHISDDCKHPILLPRKGEVSDLIIRQCHSNVAHGGCGFTLNEIRGAGYWIVGANSAVKKSISNCVECRRFRGRVKKQKMANLSACRLKEAAPFTHRGVDMFGSFTVKQRRSTVKRYGAMFTCIASRAVHIEVTFSLDTDSFILALRRLGAQRGNIRSIYSYNGSNFIDAEQELKKVYMEMDDRKIQSFLLEQGGDWIRWHKNPPLASHMSGVWEQQIHSARAILGSLLKTHGECLDDASLFTVMTEVEDILNSRPLTIEVLNDPTNLQPLSPVNILTMKSKVVSPPPEENFPSLIYIVENVGDVSNTLPMSFGLATCSLCKNAKNGKAKEETSKLGILLLYIRTMFQETNGQLQE